MLGCDKCLIYFHYRQSIMYYSLLRPKICYTNRGLNTYVLCTCTILYQHSGSTPPSSYVGVFVLTFLLGAGEGGGSKNSHFLDLILTTRSLVEIKIRDGCMCVYRVLEYFDSRVSNFAHGKNFPAKFVFSLQTQFSGTRTNKLEISGSVSNLSVNYLKFAGSGRLKFEKSVVLAPANQIYGKQKNGSPLATNQYCTEQFSTALLEILGRRFRPKFFN